MLRARHDAKRRQTVITLDTRGDCIDLVNCLVEKMNRSPGGSVRLRIKTEA